MIESRDLNKRECIYFNPLICSLKKNQPLYILVVLYVSRDEGQLLDKRGRRDERILFFQGGISPPKVGIDSGDPVIQRNDSVPSERKQHGLALGLFQPRLGQKFLLRHDGVINLESSVFEDRPEKTGVEVIDNDIRIDQEFDFCHSRISLRKASSDRSREPLRIS